MEKKLFTIVMILTFVVSVQSQSLIPAGKYIMKRDKVNNGVVSNSDNISVLKLQINSNEDYFTGSFIDIDNDSQLIGKAYTSKRNPLQTLISITQVDSDFYAVHVGILKDGVIKGNWHSSGGHSGDFTLYITY